MESTPTTPMTPAPNTARRPAPRLRLPPLLLVLAAGGLTAHAHAQPAAPPIPIRPHPAQPGIFEFRGKPTVLVTSGEHYGAVLNRDFDWRVYLDELAARGVNFTRIFSGSYVERPGAFGIEKNTLAPAPASFVTPWARSKTDAQKFDLDRWDPEYFQRLTGFVAEAGKRGIVVEMSLFSALYGNPGWEASPLHPNNNVNGVGKVKDRKQVHTLHNGNLLVRQEQMTRKIVQALAGADNVIFEIQNEPWADLAAWEGNVAPANAASLAWQARIAQAIVAAEQSLPHRHLIAQNIANRSVRVPAAIPHIGLYNFHYTSPPDAVAMNAHLGQPIGFDESGFDGGDDRTYRSQAWHFILAGGATFDSLDYSFSTAHPDGTEKQKAPGGGSTALRTQLGFLLRLVHGFGDTLLAMRPDPSVCKSGAPAQRRVLAAAGRAYLIYLEPAPMVGAAKPGSAPPLTVDLPFGRYVVQWFDPRTGQPLASETIQHAGGARELRMPSAPEDLAASIVRQSEDPALPDGGRDGVVSLPSPKGNLRIAALLADLAGTPGYPGGRRLYYRIDRRVQGEGKSTTWQPLLPWSPLGLTRSDADFVDGLSWATNAPGAARTINESYRLLTGKRLDNKVTARARTLLLRGRSGETLAVDLRAHDDGVAFRYRFPEKKPGAFTVTGEATGFRIPLSARATLTPHDDANQWKPAYENYWDTNLPVGASAPQQAGWSFPALFHIGDAWALVSESGLDAGYFGARLAQDAQHGIYRVRLPDPMEGEGRDDVTAHSSLPWTMPWRVVIAGSGLAPIVESNLITHLAPVSKVKDTRWIKPGRASWSWWPDSQSPRSYEKLAAYVDLAAEMGWEYSLVDANWDTMEGGDWRKLATYAAGKKVKLLLWYNSGGPHNVVSERPRDLMHNRDKRRTELRAIAAAGIAGLKVDFFHSDKQQRIAQYLGIIEDAAEFRLLVNFHGCTIPRGWSRTYPNLVGHEAVKGAEVYKFGEEFPARAAAHNAIVPFTRNVIGPMDYTPASFSDSENKHVTTNGHELALTVVFENGILHVADGKDSIRGLPAAVKDFLRVVPSAWDDTRLLAGEPGKLAVLVRRSGRDFFIGGINGEASAKEISLPLAFLPAGSFTTTTIADGDSDRTFITATADHGGKDSVTIKLRGNGGFVMRLVPKKK